MWIWDEQIKNLFRFMIAVLPFTKQSTAVEDKVQKASEETEEASKQPNNRGPYTRPQLIGLIIGPLFFMAIKLFISPETMSSEANTVLASIAWIATWWVTEAVPIPITSLLPIIIFPLGGVMETGEVTASYGDSLIFLFAGSFMIALSMEKWNLHRRVALTIISIIGTNPSTIVLGFMVATGFLSMWISNTATTMMMVPISLAVTKHVSDSLKSQTQVDTSPGKFNFGQRSC